MHQDLLKVRITESEDGIFEVIIGDDYVEHFLSAAEALDHAWRFYNRHNKAFQSADREVRVVKAPITHS